MKIYISRKEHFCAAHRIFNPNWTEEKNDEVFGPCSSKNFHGHNYELTVSIKGEPAEETGYVMNIKDLSEIIHQEILSKVDHKNLNLDVDFFKDTIPSTENIVFVFWSILYQYLKKHHPKTTLHCIELYETQKNSVRYYGE